MCLTRRKYDHLSPLHMFCCISEKLPRDGGSLADDKSMELWNSPSQVKAFTWLAIIYQTLYEYSGTSELRLCTGLL